MDPRLVVPEEFVLPLPVDLSFHLLPTLFLLVDALLLSPPWKIRPLAALGLSATLAVAYWIWVEICHEENGFYPYPLFDVVGREGRMGVFAGSAVLLAAGTLELGWGLGVLNGGLAGRRGR